MKSRIIAAVIATVSVLAAQAQLPRVYDEDIDPMTQIDRALLDAADAGKHVVCQVGGNWCRWCLMFADFVTRNEEVARVIDDNFVYIHVNYPTDGSAEDLLRRLHNPGRFGYPALVVLDADGNVLHIQDSSFLEEGEGYNLKKVLRFLNNWTPSATAR